MTEVISVTSGKGGCVPTSPRLGLFWFTLFRGPELQGQLWCPRNGLGTETRPLSGTSRSQPAGKGFPLPGSVGSHRHYPTAPVGFKLASPLHLD